MSLKFAGTLVEKLKRGENAELKHENPYLQEALKLEGILYTNEDLSTQFPTLFVHNELPLVLEIGCYMGKSVLEMAHGNPSVNFLGLDITYKRTVKAARKIKLQNLTNARVGICDALSFLNMIPDCSLDGVCVFFPDPWPKKRHEKNRLLREDFFQVLRLKLKTDGFFWLKTDHQEYFESACDISKVTGWTHGNDFQPALVKGGPYVTQFEGIFLERNEPTYSRVFCKTLP